MKWLVAFNIIFDFCILSSNVLAEKALRFQVDNIPNIEDFVTLPLNQLNGAETLDSYSLSFWIKIDFFRPYNYAFSYAITDIKSNEFNMKINPDSISLALGGSYLKLAKPATLLVADKWYHVRISVNQTSHVLVSLNGDILYDKDDDTQALYLNGSFLLGQETDLIDGGFVKEQSLSGWLTSFNLFSRAMTMEEFDLIGDCNRAENFASGDLINWATADWSFNGNVIEEEVDICADMNKGIMEVALEPLSITGAKSICSRIFASEIFVPKNEAENDYLYEETMPYVDICKSRNHATGYLWLGATDKPDNGIWNTFNGIKLNYTNFRKSGASSTQSCAAMEKGMQGEWDDLPCNGNNALCPACNANENSVLKMRGTCDEKSFGTFFKVKGKMNGKFYFKGFTRYLIYYMNDTETWILEDLWLNGTYLASYFTHNGDYPVGVKEWKTLQNYTLCGLVEGSPISLSFSNCGSKEFTCNNGDCTAIEKRCDLFTDCSDNSDEIGCNKLNLPPAYMANLMPSGIDTEQLRVNMSLSIEKIVKIDVVDMKIQFYLAISFSWIDPRLGFYNLKMEDDLNIIQNKDVWIPEVSYPNADFQSIYHSKPVLCIKRLSKPEKDSSTRTLRDNVFKGSKNGLQLNQMINAPFDCWMYLYNFPFDTQTCTIIIRFKSARATLVTWGDVSAIYNGARELTEYEVGDAEIHTENDSRGFSKVEISIKLSRRYSYYITTTYIPTMMLVIISYMSLFCKFENVDLRVMMTITTLLVLYSLYQQISGNLPKTSYVKAIDIWCFFALTVIFTQVVFHVILELDMFESIVSKQLSGTKKIDTIQAYNNTESYKQEKKQQLKLSTLKWSRITYIVALIIFLAVYITAIVVNMKAEEHKTII